MFCIDYKKLPAEEISNNVSDLGNRKENMAYNETPTTLRKAMNKNAAIAAVTVMSAALAVATHKRTVKHFQKKIDRLYNEQIDHHMEGWQRGWEQAKQEYTLWYTREQYQLVFGVDRGY